MRWQELTSRDHRQLDGDWVPIVGDVVCVHLDSYSIDNYLANVTFIDNSLEDYRRVRVRVQPRTSPTYEQYIHASKLEPTRLTFQGNVCVRCRRRRIR